MMKVGIIANIAGLMVEIKLHKIEIKFKKLFSIVDKLLLLSVQVGINADGHPSICPDMVLKDVDAMAKIFFSLFLHRTESH